MLSNYIIIIITSQLYFTTKRIFFNCVIIIFRFNMTIRWRLHPFKNFGQKKAGRYRPAWGNLLVKNDLFGFFVEQMDFIKLKGYLKLVALLCCSARINTGGNL